MFRAFNGWKLAVVSNTGIDAVHLAIFFLKIFNKWITDKPNEPENKQISVLAVPASFVSAVKSKRER